MSLRREPRQLVADGSRNGIHIGRASDGGGLRQVTSNPDGDDPFGSWSPNGKRIVFNRFGPETDEGLFVVNVDGKGLKQILRRLQTAAVFGRDRARPSDAFERPSTGSRRRVTPRLTLVLFAALPDDSGSAVADAFISYSRRDQELVRELHRFLVAEGRDVWVDWEDIPAASRWEQDIEESLDSADSVVFVVSAASLASKYCGLEFEHAQKRGKRIVPLAIDNADPDAAPTGLRQLNWIWCRDGDDRDERFAQVARALDTDLDWARAHTRLLVRAVEWDARGRPSALLLRGKTLEEAIEQLAQHREVEPKPTDLQHEYVQASRRGARRRQRTVLGGVSFALAVAITLAIVALLQRNTANERARIAQSQALASQAEEALDSAPANALRLALAAMHTHRTQEARAALRDAVLANPVLSVGRAPKTAPLRGARPDALTYSGDGRVLVGLTPDSQLHVWGADGAELAPMRRATHAAASPSGGRVVHADGRLVRVQRLHRPGSGIARRLRAGEHAAATGFAGARPLVLAVGGRGGARIVDVGTGRSVALERPHVPIAGGVWSADGTTVVTLGAADSDDPLRVWDARTGRLRATLPSAAAAAVNRDGTGIATFGDAQGTLWSRGDVRPRAHAIGAEVTAVAFSPDGSSIAAVGPTGAATLWRVADGRLLTVFPESGSFQGAAGTTVNAPAFAPAAAFSPDGRQLAVAAANATVRLFDRASGKQVESIATGWVNALAFAPDGARLAAMSWDGGVVVARTPAIRLESGYSVGACTWPPVTSPDGRYVVSDTGGGGVALSRLDGRVLAVLRPPMTRHAVAAPQQPAFSGDGSVVAVSTAKCVNAFAAGERFGTAVWRIGSSTPVLRLPTAHASSILLDRRGSVLLLDGRAREVPSGRRLPRLDGVASYSADGSRAVRLRRRTLQVVRVPSGVPVATLPGAVPRDATSVDVSASFSPDGSRLVTRASDGPSDLWNSATGERLASFGPGIVAFAEGGRRLVVVSGRLIRTYRSADASLLATRPTSPADEPAISPDGAFVAIARDNGRLDLVDATTGVRTQMQTGTGAALANVDFVPRSDLLAISDATGGAYLVSCTICAPDDTLLARGRAVLARASRVPRRPPPLAATIP